MSSTREENVNTILNKLFINGSGQIADRLVLVQEELPAKATIANARDLGGWSRPAVRDVLLGALHQHESEARAKEREQCAKRAASARLPKGYQWGRDAMEQFNFGKERAAKAVREGKPQE